MKTSTITHDMNEFSGKRILVTGGTKGIGEAVANRLRRGGGTVLVTARTSPPGVQPEQFIQADAATPDGTSQIIKTTLERLRGLDILINNSGIIRDRTIKKLTSEEFESVVRVNLAGTFNVTQKAGAILRKDGRIVNLSSVSGQMGLFGQANYSSSKAAIIALTKVSAREFARQNITVNAIAPGFIDIGMSKGMPDEVTANFIKQIPLGRLGDAENIVDAALFLCSPMASYITGQVLNVNGGYYMG